MSISKKPGVKALREEALRFDEYATTAYWEHIFNKYIFQDDSWFVASQQPPAPGSLRRIDLLVKGIAKKGIFSYLLVVEAKSGTATPRDMEQVEYQALYDCMEHLAFTERRKIWAMTCFGPKARLWAFHVDDEELTQLFPVGNSLAERSEYADFAEEEDNFIKAFRLIAKNPEPPSELFKKGKTTPPRSSSGQGSGQPQQDRSDTAMSGSSYRSAYDQPQVLRSDVLNPDDCVYTTVLGMEDGSLVIQIPDGTQRRTSPDQWYQTQMYYADQLQACFAYDGRTGTRYWTSVLEPVDMPGQGKGKGKGKGKR